MHTTMAYIPMADSMLLRCCRTYKACATSNNMGESRLGNALPATSDVQDEPCAAISCVWNQSMETYWLQLLLPLYA
jgi:hypothetical protein